VARSIFDAKPPALPRDRFSHDTAEGFFVQKKHKMFENARPG
jgi:hypothetical protein